MRGLDPRDVPVAVEVVALDEEPAEAVRVARAVDAARRCGAVDRAAGAHGTRRRRDVLRVVRRVQVVQRRLGAGLGQIPPPVASETVAAVDLGLEAREQVADAADVGRVGGVVVLDRHVDLRGRHRRVTRVDLAVGEHRELRVDRIPRTGGRAVAGQLAEHRRERAQIGAVGAVVDRVEVDVDLLDVRVGRALAAERIRDRVTLGRQRVVVDVPVGHRLRRRRRPRSSALPRQPTGPSRPGA